MSLPLTPEVVAAAYEFLRHCPPFRGWKLPEADAVEFHVTRHRDRYADHTLDRKQHRIRVSSHNVKTTYALLQAVAHEIIHEYQDGIAKSGSRKTDHNAEFVRLSKRVCRAHGFDPETFL